MHEHQADQADNAKSKQELLIEEYNIPLTLASADNFRGFFRKVRNGWRSGYRHQLTA